MILAIVSVEANFSPGSTSNEYEFNVRFGFHGYN